MLVGYRGTGKSTVGRILADRLDRPFLDADREIEARAGRPIRSIFAESGEPAFRDREERTLAELTAGLPVQMDLIDVNDASGAFLPPSDDERNAFHDALTAELGRAPTGSAFARHTPTVPANRSRGTS